MKLYLDTTNNLKTFVRVGEAQLTKTYLTPQEQDILGAIEELLQREHLKITDITSLEVNPGPGSFTGTRLGVAIANAMAFALGININDNKPPIEARYSSPPNITTPKKG